MINVSDQDRTQTGFHYTVRADGIILYYVNDLKTCTIDHLTETVSEIDRRHAEANLHCRSLTDISQISFLTPYAIRRIHDMVMATPPNLRESVAVVTPTTMIYTFVNVAFRNLPIARTSNTQFFSTREAAFAWLDERLEQLGP